MEKSRSLVLKEVKELRQEYYYNKQQLAEYEKLINTAEEYLLKTYFQKEGIEYYLIVYYLKELEFYIHDKNELAKLKVELDKLPHIPNKQERKVIRQLKQKANVNKQS